MTILLCTSLRPSPRTRTFCNDLVAASADFQYFTRGKSNLAYLSAYTKSSGAGRLWILSSRYGDPKVVECYNVEGSEPIHMASFLIARVKLRREVSGLSRANASHKRLKLMPADSPSLSRLHGCLNAAIGNLYSGVENATELHLIRGKDCLAEMFFVDSVSKLPCGPALQMKDFRCLE